MSTGMADAPSTKQCPDCAENVRAEANVCRFCGADFRPRPASPGMNAYAIASLVAAVVWVWGAGAILAVVFGHLALRQIKRTGQGGRAFAIAGLVLGYLGIVAALIGLAAFVTVTSGTGVAVFPG